MSNDLFGAVAILVIIGVGVVAFTPAFASGADRVTASETVTVDYQNTSNVTESGLRYDDEISATNASGTELREDIDYVWDAETGSIEFVNTSRTSSGESVDIVYQYREADARQRTIGTVVSSLGFPLVFLLFLLAGGYVFTVIN